MVLSSGRALLVPFPGTKSAYPRPSPIVEILLTSKANEKIKLKNTYSGSFLESPNNNDAKLSVTSLCSLPLPRPILRRRETLCHLTSLCSLPLPRPILRCAILQTRVPLKLPTACIAFSRCLSPASPLQQKVLSYTGN